MPVKFTALMSSTHQFAPATTISLTAYGIHASVPDLISGLMIGLLGSAAIERANQEGRRANLWLLVTSFLSISMMAVYIAHDVYVWGHMVPAPIVIGFAGMTSTTLVRFLAEKLPEILARRLGGHKDP